MYSDYSLRILLYLAAHQDRLIPLSEITTLHNVSHHHLVKVVQNLVAQGYVNTIRGKAGGMQLAMASEALNIGDIVRATEPHMNLLECFEQKTNTCPLISECRLKGVLYQARKKFMDTLDAYTLADML